MMRRCQSFGIVVAGLIGVLTAGGAAPVPDDDGAPKLRAVWPVGPFEVRAAFDPGAGPSVAESAVGATIRFEEEGAPPGSEDGRGRLRVTAARLADDGATLVLTTDPHPRAGRYSLRLAGRDASYDLSGVEATWQADGDDEPAWSGRWPAFDARAWAAFAATAPPSAHGGAYHERPGRLTLTSLLELPEGAWTIRVRAETAVEPTLDGLEPTGDGPATFEAESTGVPLLLSVVLPTGPGQGASSSGLRVTVEPAEGTSAERPLAASETLLPWVPPSPAAPGPPAGVPDLDGGDPARGALVFQGAESKCASCHRVRGVGGDVGPDLTGLVGRDRAEVYRDIAEPSVRIHPDYVSYTVALKDGRIFAGTVRSEGADAIRITDTEARSTLVPRAEVEDVRPSATSIMPVGLAGALGEQGLRDLIAFLTTPTAAPRDH